MCLGRTGLPFGQAPAWAPSIGMWAPRKSHFLPASSGRSKWSKQLIVSLLAEQFMADSRVAGKGLIWVGTSGMAHLCSLQAHPPHLLLGIISRGTSGLVSVCPQGLASQLGTGDTIGPGWVLYIVKGCV